MKNTKKPNALLDAEALYEAKCAEWRAANNAVERLKGELDAAGVALSKARMDADSALPQCRIVRVSRFSGYEYAFHSVVIVRKTPSGTLVVRGIGAPGMERKFKPCAISGRFKQVGDATLELRDVPAEYRTGGLQNASKESGE